MENDLAPFYLDLHLLMPIFAKFTLSLEVSMPVYFSQHKRSFENIIVIVIILTISSSLNNMTAEMLSDIQYVKKTVGGKQLNLSLYITIETHSPESNL